MTQKTHYADDETLEYIAQLESQLAAANARLAGVVEECARVVDAECIGFAKDDEQLNRISAAIRALAPQSEQPADGGWMPIETAPKDNKRPLYLSRIADGELKELDFDGIWRSESESWEMPEVYYFWDSAHGIEEPTHWAYQDRPLPPLPKGTE